MYKYLLKCEKSEKSTRLSINTLSCCTIGASFYIIHLQTGPRFVHKRDTITNSGTFHHYVWSLPWPALSTYPHCPHLSSPLNPSQQAVLTDTTTLKDKTVFSEVTLREGLCPFKSAPPHARLNVIALNASRPQTGHSCLPGHTIGPSDIFECYMWLRSLMFNLSGSGVSGTG